jgi:hypothetical protein
MNSATGIASADETLRAVQYCGRRPVFIALGVSDPDGFRCGRPGCGGAFDLISLGKLPAQFKCRICGNEPATIAVDVTT